MNRAYRGGVIDLVVLVVLLVAAASGWRQGFVTAVLGAVGWVSGLLLALRYVPPFLARHVATTGPVLALAQVVVIFACAALGGALMHAVARAIMRSLVLRPLRSLDSLAGAVAAVAVTAFAVWSVAAVVRPVLPETASKALTDSRSVRILDGTMPGPARDLLSTVRRAVTASGFPSVFSGLTPEAIRPVPVPDSGVAAQPAVREAAGSIVKVLAQSTRCRVGEEGSGWVVAPQRVVTNAHVVTGSNSVTVRVGGVGRPLRATVVAFDPRLDLSVLQVPGLTARPLPRQSSPLGSGASAAVAGFPGGGAYTVKAARVRGAMVAVGHDIYGSGSVTRNVYALRTTVRPGNSGGPLLTTTGRVAGTVFARSMDDASTGYALSDSTTAALLNRASSLSQPVGTGACPVR